MPLRSDSFLPQDVPVNTDFLCDKAALLGDIIKDTSVFYLFILLGNLLAAQNV
jgi:hypothetical protein